MAGDFLARRLLNERNARVIGLFEATQAVPQTPETAYQADQLAKRSTGLEPLEQPAADAVRQVRELGAEIAKVQPPERRQVQNFTSPGAVAYQRIKGQGSGETPVLGRYSISQGPGPSHSTGPGGRAWDYAVPIGTKAQATVGGTVISVQDLGNRSYGRYIQIRGDDGKTYIYAHLSQFGVQRGQRVEPGMVIARTGNTGRTTGPHLHFEIRG